MSLRAAALRAVVVQLRAVDVAYLTRTDTAMMAVDALAADAATRDALAAIVCDHLSDCIHYPDLPGPPECQQVATTVLGALAGQP